MSFLNRYKVFFHVTFWVACFFILFQLFTKDYYNGIIDWVYTGLFLLPMIAIVYISQTLLGFAIKTKSLVIYIVGIGGIVVLGIALHYFVFDVLSDLLFPDYFIASYFTIWELVQYCLVFLVVSTLMKLTKDWFLVKDREVHLMQENHQVQLSSLKSQINPHFLFNSLNNIYSLSSNSPEATRNYILKLSDALRYMIYETAEDKVLLQNELNYLSDFIALEKLRMSNSEKVSFAYPDDTSELIAPLILLPLVENCFKHVDQQCPEIDIQIDLDGTKLKMVTSNSFQLQSRSKIGGLGLDNLKKRLAILYPDRHTYTTESKNEYFISTLTLDLQP